MKLNPFAKASTLLKEREHRHLAQQVRDALRTDLTQTVKDLQATQQQRDEAARDVDRLHRIHGGTLRLGVVRVLVPELEANLRRFEPSAHVKVDQWGDAFIVTVHYHEAVEEGVLNRMKAELESHVKPDWT